MNYAGSNGKPRYLIADAWLLSQYTHGSLANKLSSFLIEQDLTVAIDSYALVELFNPDWSHIPFLGRTRYVSEFLVDHAAILVNPQEVLLAEARSYPTPLQSIPISADLSAMNWSVRDWLIKGLFRREKDLVHLGLDFGKWHLDYKNAKDSWPSNVKSIINHAVSNGLLIKGNDGSIDIDESDKDAFLRSLDQRFLRVEFHRDAPYEEFNKLADNIEDLYMGGTSRLPAVRLTSLAFWHAYVQLDKAFIMHPKGSDLGDIYRMTLLPYCDYFTLDKSMGRVLSRVLMDLPQSANILGPAIFRNPLNNYAPEPGQFLRY